MWKEDSSRAVKPPAPFEVQYFFDSHTHRSGSTQKRPRGLCLKISSALWTNQTNKVTSLVYQFCSSILSILMHDMCSGLRS